MSSNRTSEADLHSSGARNHVNHTSIASPDANKGKIFKLEAMLIQKDEQISSLKNINQNLVSEVKEVRQDRDQTKVEVLQLKQKAKQTEQLRFEMEKNKDRIQRLLSEKEDLEEKVQMLEFKSKNYMEEMQVVRDSYEQLREDFEELKNENNELRKSNIELEKDTHILQCNVDKVTRLLDKASADSMRYKSVVDLQKSALCELQRDLNKTAIDFNPNSSLVSDTFQRPNKNNRLLQTAKSADYEKDILVNSNFDPKVDTFNPYVKEISDLGSLKDFEKNVHKSREMNNIPKNLFNHYSVNNEGKRRAQNLSGQLFENNRENYSYLVNKSKFMMERTFDHTVSHHNLSRSKHISMVSEGQNTNKSMVAKYVPKPVNSSLGIALTKKRMSTEQLMHVSPSNSSPDITTEKSDSFITTSTVQNPDDHIDPENRPTSKNEFVTRPQTRRESRMLIQPLPRLFTQSKYEGFRQAKSSERSKGFHSSRDRYYTDSQPTTSKEQDNKRGSTVFNFSPVGINSEAMKTAIKERREKSNSRLGQYKGSESQSHLSSAARKEEYRKTTASSKQSVLKGGKERTTSRSKFYKTSNASEASLRSGKLAKEYVAWTQNRKDSTSSKKGNLIELVANKGKDSQLKTLEHHLNIITERKSKLEKDIAGIERTIQKTKKAFKYQTSRNQHLENSLNQLTKSDPKSSLSKMETSSKKRRKLELEKELEIVNRSIANVKYRIKAFK